MYNKAVLGNGIRVITHSMNRMQSAALGIWIKIGGRYELPPTKGIAHFLEHLLFKGTKHYSCRQIKQLIEGVGGSLNGFTSEELTCYLVKIPGQHLGLALDILFDMVINPAMLEPDIAKEKTVILEEIKMYKDLPQSYVHELLDELLWPNQPLGASIIGSAGSVNKISRQDLVDFKNKYYTPLNIVVSAAGLLTHDKFVRNIARISSVLDAENINIFPAAKEKQDKPQLKVLHKDTEQAHLALGFHGFKRGHPLRYGLMLLHTILGANMSSRLFEELREKRGLAYSIGTQLKFFQDTGSFVVHAGIDNSKIKQTLSLIFKELSKVKRELVTEGELKRAKEFCLGQLMLNLEDTLEHMLWIGESSAALDKTYSLTDVIRQVNKIKRSDIRDIARGIFRQERINLALIGPPQDKRGHIYNQLRLP